MSEEPAKWSSSRRRGPSPSSTFPAKLFQILSNPEFSHIITWMPHGRSWRVLQPKAFSEVVSPKYFSHQSKYSSFMRQVNGWGFKRITRGPDRNSYYHELFVRDNPELAWTMSRRGNSSFKGSGKDEADKEPNFYEMTGLSSNSTSIGQNAGSSSGFYSGSATPGGYEYHEGHGPLYGSGADHSTGGNYMNSHHYAQPLMSDRHSNFNPYMGRLNHPSASGNHLPDDYGGYSPNAGFPPSMPGGWPSMYPNPGGMDYPQNYYNYGKPSQYFPQSAAPLEDPNAANAAPGGSLPWSEDGQNAPGQRGPPPSGAVPESTESSHLNEEHPESQQQRQARDWQRDPGPRYPGDNR